MDFLFLYLKYWYSFVFCPRLQCIPILYMVTNSRAHRSQAGNANKFNRLNKNCAKLDSTLSTYKRKVVSQFLLITDCHVRILDWDCFIRNFFHEKLEIQIFISTLPVLKYWKLIIQNIFKYSDGQTKHICESELVHCLQVCYLIYIHFSCTISNILIVSMTM